MKKIIYLVLALFVITLNNCKPDRPDPKEPPVAAFSADITIIDAGQTVYFTDESINDPAGWAWNFGDDPGTIVHSTAQNPSHIYLDAGTFSVILAVANDAGEDALVKTNYITVRGTDIIFNNPIFTDIHITLNGDTKTILPGGSVTYHDVSGSSVSYTAYTNGATTGGTQIGLKLEWNNTLTLSGGTDTYDLDVGDDYFFLYMRNYGTHVLTPLYVNYGLSSQTEDYIEIPTDNVNYEIGYYKAWTNSNVRMYYKDAPSSYVYWNQGSNFYIPWTNNQKIELYNNLKKSSVEGKPVKIKPIAWSLVPESNTKKEFVFNKNAIKLYCK